MTAGSTKKSQCFGETTFLECATLLIVADTSVTKEVIELDNDTATVIIGVIMLMVAFATLVLKIIEVARSK